MSQHNPFRVFGVADPAIATAGAGLDFLNRCYGKYLSITLNDNSPPRS